MHNKIWVLHLWSGVAINIRMTEYPDTRQDKLSWNNGFVKIHNLHMLSVKNDNFDAEMNNDSDEDSKDLAAVFINSDSENLIFFEKDKWIIEIYFM